MNKNVISEVFERASIGLSLVDSDFCYLWVNSEMANLLGYEPAELIGKSFVDLTHPDDLELDVEFSNQAFRGEIPYFSARKRYLRKDGSTMVGDLLATVMFDGDGHPEGGFAILVDAGRVDPVTRRIEHLQRSSAVGQITAGFAHDLRNSLAVLSSVEGLLRANVDRDRALELLTATTAGASEMVDSLLAYATPGEGRSHGRVLPELLAESLPILRLVVPAGTELVVSDLPPVEALIDRSEFQQVVLNLVLNARDATPATGGRIEISAESIPDDPDCFDLVVSDNGRGMSVSDMERAFDPYFTTKGESGTGLGLPISQEIVARNGGTILANSALGKGSRFVVRLPIVAPFPSNAA